METEYGGSVLIRGDNFYRGGKSRPTFTRAGATGATSPRSTLNITKGNFENATVLTSVRSNLITILGRTAAYRGTLVTWDGLLTANETRLEADLKGLKDWWRVARP